MNEARHSNLGGLGIAMGVALALFGIPMLVLLASIFGLAIALAMAVAVVVALVVFRTAETVEEHQHQREMEKTETVPSYFGLRTDGRPKVGWLSQAVLSGFIASMAMLFAFALAYAVALSVAALMGITGADTASRVNMAGWLYNLAHNPLTDRAQSSLYFAVGAHVTMGLVFAAIYAYWAEPRMWGPHWVRGLVFSVIPWLFSVAVFFPLAGGGFLGTALGAGPLPFLGNLVLHGIYGAVLGAMYGPWGDIMPAVEETRTQEHYQAMADAEGAAAKGVISGLVLGLILGAVGGGLLQAMPNLGGGPTTLTILGLALTGGALGALVGSLLGLPQGVKVTPSTRM
jgi:hypothetical protein